MDGGIFMNYASKDLRNEHEGILFGLKILEKIVGRIQNNETYEMNDTKEMINFLKLFADKCHHGKEEGLFFPAILEIGHSTCSPIIDQMLYEHTEGRKHIAEMQAAVDGIFKDQDFAKAATEYIKLLRSHIMKENNVLFDIADKIIPEDKQLALLEEFEEFEEEVMGEGTHAKLHKMLDTFKEKYMKDIVK